MLNRSHIDTVVRAALDEDAPWGDLTSTTLIPADAAATADLVAMIAAVADYRVDPPLRAPATGEAILDAVDAVRGG